MRDSEPAFYFTAVEFPLNGTMVKRHGLITCVRLEPFQNGVILPHEKTFTNVKSERLALLKACRTNFSPIFSLYDDKHGILQQLKQAVDGIAPDLQFTEHNGFRHTLWRIVSRDLHRWVTAAMAPRRLYIADGHHRYETALNYRNWLAQNSRDFNDRHSANFVLTYLCSLDDPGLVILPAHRLITGVSQKDLEGLIAGADKYFDLRRFAYREDQRRTVFKEFVTALESNPHQRSIGVIIRPEKAFYVFTLREGVMTRLIGDDIAKPLQDLDVTVLTRLVFTELLGFDQARLDNEKLIEYTVDAAAAADAVHMRKADAAFILNPTSVNDVCRIARLGLVMPRKATYFYPKVTTGLVFNRLDI
jgi:uncharacterized protein (DUF1015 family)